MTWRCARTWDADDPSWDRDAADWAARSEARARSALAADMGRDGRAASTALRALFGDEPADRLLDHPGLDGGER